MTLPTFVSFTATAYTSTTSPKTTANIAVQAGDLLIAYTCAENDAGNIDIAVANATGTDPTWVQRQERQPNSNLECYSSIWSGVAPASENITVQFTISATGAFFGGEVHVWRDSDGLGNTAQNNNGTGSGAPTVNITTTADNSALSVGIADWNAVITAPTWSGGTAVTRTDQDTGGANYAVRTATYADMGAAGAQTVGNSAPSTQRYQIMVVEILGTVAPPEEPPGILMGQACM